MIRTIRTWYQQRRDALRAEAAYFALDRQMGSLYRQLRQVGDHFTRYHLLARAGRAQLDMAALLPAAFGPDPLPDEPGRDLADALASSGHLLAMVADAENAIAVADTRRRYGVGAELEAAAGPILDRAIAAGIIGRAVLDELYDAVEPLVGPQAAETIACLPTVERRGDFHPAG